MTSTVDSLISITDAILDHRFSIAVDVACSHSSRVLSGNAK